MATEQAKALSARGHEVRVVTTDLVWKGRRAPEPTFELLRPFGPEVDYSKAWSLARWPGSVGPILSPGSLPLIRRAVDWADVVHGHEWPHATVQTARRLSRQMGKAFVMQPHGSIQRRAPGWKDGLHHGFNITHALRNSEVFIALGAHEGAEISDVLGAFARIHIVVNPMSIPSLDDLDDVGERRERQRSSWGCPPQAQLLLYAHRLAPNKGLDIAIGALPHLPESTYLIVVGPDSVDPRFTAQCRALSSRLGVESRVRFMGPSPRRAMLEVISACDIFILPARRDTFPMSVLQALACGRPTVITNTCQSAHALEGAVLVSQPDPTEFARHIASIGPVEAERLGTAARELIATRFSPQAVAEELEAVYRETIDSAHLPGIRRRRATIIPPRLPTVGGSPPRRDADER